jgi:hypothetical protein
MRWRLLHHDNRLHRETAIVGATVEDVRPNSNNKTVVGRKRNMISQVETWWNRQKTDDHCINEIMGVMSRVLRVAHLDVDDPMGTTMHTNRHPDTQNSYVTRRKTEKITEVCK